MILKTFFNGLSPKEGGRSSKSPNKNDLVNALVKLKLTKIIFTR